MAKGKIFIVDDEESILESLSGVLEDEGYQTIAARNGIEALEIFGREFPDVTFLDIWMPDVDGLEVLRRLKAQDPDGVIIMISGHGTIASAIKAVKSGAFDFIEKPLDMDEILLSLERALEHRSLLLENRRLREIVRKKDPQTQPYLFPEMEAERAGSRIPSPIKLMESPPPPAGSWISPKGKGHQQRTLKQSMVLYGTGLYSGLKTGLMLLPLPPNSGVLFGNIYDEHTVPGRLMYVEETDHATSLRRGRITAKTIEHFMAVLHAYGINNLLVKMNEEIPIMDGSALDFCRIIEEAGIEGQDEVSGELIIDRQYAVGEIDPEKKYIFIEPSDYFGVRYLLNYPPPIGRQEYSFIMTDEVAFKEEIAPARTFGFLKDIKLLAKMGLVEGGRLHNVIILDEGRVMNTTLRFPDEFVRHKILDIIGDFYLLNQPIKGRITANMTGHSDNIALLREIQRDLGSH
ncbi:MAG: UDP-3-O-[3-hydroxymyristoyl] N-acetylglucosamine deacetylase [Syntrophobacterales bacterium]|nr:MAG: UDP-3-O-[3-hydroxymyristoyl] N-acetylglucosamine deacetylase [Syntrophobacterales bacterium]